jgi:glycosyl-4,4'-diaponeurosporenoate acyltransferase
VTGGVAVVVFSAAWAAFGVASGAVVSLVPESALHLDRGLLRLRSFERGGTWYRRRLGITRWKDRLPEAAGRWGNGPRKATLVSRSARDLERFAAETRRAELVHWANVLFGASFLVWAGEAVGVTMLVFGIVVHGPFIAVQRYNRARLERILGQGASAGRARSRTGASD